MEGRTKRKMGARSKSDFISKKVGGTRARLRRCSRRLEYGIVVDAC